MKSISKSYGVPGLRLGVLASSDRVFIDRMKKGISIWNINSFAEFYMQIAEKYKKDYDAAKVAFCHERSRFMGALSGIEGLRVYPSEANYFMIELLRGHSSRTMAKQLLSRHNLFIKDLSGKIKRDNRQFIRVAIRGSEDNDLLVAALKQYMAENNVLYDYHQTTLVRCSVDYEEFDISEYISTIESYAFSDCENLSKITLPQYLTAIKEYTFANCPKLESIDIPENVTKIGFGAFENCVSLKKITFHQFSHLKAVGPFAFAECSSLEEIQLPPTVTTIGTKAENGGCSFSGCESLIEMDIPAKVDFLNEAMFYNCKNLKKVIIPYNMNYIDQDLFYGCDNLEEVVLRNANTVIEDGTFDEKVKITIENQNINKIYFEI